MNDKFELKFSQDVTELLMSATTISNELLEPQVSSLDVILAALTYPDTALYSFLESNNTIDLINPESILSNIMASKEIFENIFDDISYSDFTKGKDIIGSELTTIIKDNKGNEIVNSTLFSLNYNIYAEYSLELLEAIDEAYDIDLQNGDTCIRVDTLVYCLLKNNDNLANKLLNIFFNTKGMVTNLKSYIKNTKLDKNGYIIIPNELKEYVSVLNTKIDKKTKCDILGRDKEIFMLWNIISKKTKRNAILIGEPGVGKTAIIEAMTDSIVKKKCPKQFQNFSVISLDINAMIAGTSYRGQFEEKILNFINFLDNNDNIIVFIDEIHHIMGAGSTSSTEIDLGGSLKPILSRDKVIFIGATTTDEYNRIIKRDGALSRRFEIINVKEPKIKEVKPMIKSRIKALSKFHNVTISNDMIDKIIISASSFSNIANPDRTIDLLDRSMAIAKILNSPKVEMKHIKEVYKDSFEKFEKTPLNVKRSTAYHEAGHFAIWLLSQTKINSQCILVSILPANYWEGVTLFEANDIREFDTDITFLKDELRINLAGRISQKLISSRIDSGASSDLQHAVQIVEDFIMKYGIIDDFLNYSFATNSTYNTLPISDNMSDKIRNKSMDLIKEVYEETEKLIQENKSNIKRVANLLLEQGIITCEEAENAFYNKCFIKHKERVGAN